MYIKLPNVIIMSDCVVMFTKLPQKVQKKVSKRRIDKINIYQTKLPLCTSFIVKNIIYFIHTTLRVHGFKYSN